MRWETWLQLALLSLLGATIVWHLGPPEKWFDVEVPKPTHKYGAVAGGTRVDEFIAFLRPRTDQPEDSAPVHLQFAVLNMKKEARQVDLPGVYGVRVDDKPGEGPNLPATIVIRTVTGSSARQGRAQLAGAERLYVPTTIDPGEEKNCEIKLGRGLLPGGTYEVQITARITSKTHLESNRVIVTMPDLPWS